MQKLNVNVLHPHLPLGEGPRLRVILVRVHGLSSWFEFMV